MEKKKKKKSLDDWLEKYYPVSAGDCILASRDEIEYKRVLIAIDHTILKYSGTKPGVLRLYHMHKAEHTLYANVQKETYYAKPTNFSFGYLTCALCMLCVPNPESGWRPLCRFCPITEFRGKPCFNTARKTKFRENLYTSWASDKIPTERILEFLKALKEWYKTKEKGEK